MKPKHKKIHIALYEEDLHWLKHLNDFEEDIIVELDFDPEQSKFCFLKSLFYISAFGLYQNYLKLLTYFTHALPLTSI